MSREGIVVGALGLFFAACAPPAPAVSPDPCPTVPAAPPAASGAAPAVLAAVEPTKLVVSAADPSWGNADAPVTLVWFGNFECPFTRKSVAVMDGLMASYGPEKLRIVWKNYPSTTPDYRLSAWRKADASVVVLQRKGTDAFWKYLHAAFATEPFPGGSDAAALASVGVTPGDVDTAMATGAPSRKVESDDALTKDVNITGTPAFFLNGVFIGGAQSPDVFREVLDRQLASARDLKALGVPAAELSARLTAVQLGTSKMSRTQPIAAADAIRTAVPVGASPSRGPRSAAVTVIGFGSFDDFGWRRQWEQLEQLRKDRGDRVRLVWKHLAPETALTAEPAAQLLLEARAQKGDDAFWKAFDLLVAGAGRGPSDLDLIATRAGLSAKTTQAAIASHKHRALVDADMDLGDAFNVSPGTFYVNGRTFTNSTFDKIREVIDVELAHPPAAGPSDAGEPYAAVLRTATPPRPLPEVTLPAPEASVPSTGPADAPVTITFFGKLDDADSRALWHRLREKVLPGLGVKTRIVFYPVAEDAAADRLQRMALFGLRKKDGATFFKLVDAFARVAPGADDGDVLRGYAKSVGLDEAALAAAPVVPDTDPLFASSKRVSAAVDMTGTPTVIVGKTLLRGLVSEARLRRVLRSIVPAKKP